MLQSMGSQRVRNNLAAEQQQIQKPFLSLLTQENVLAQIQWLETTHTILQSWRVSSSEWVSLAQDQSVNWAVFLLETVGENLLPCFFHLQETSCMLSHVTPFFHLQSQQRNTFIPPSVCSFSSSIYKDSCDYFVPIWVVWGKVSYNLNSPFHVT